MIVSTSVSFGLIVIDGFNSTVREASALPSLEVCRGVAFSSSAVVWIDQRDPWARWDRGPFFFGSTRPTDGLSFRTAAGRMSLDWSLGPGPCSWISLFGPCRSCSARGPC